MTENEWLKFSNRFSLPISWVGDKRVDCENILYRLYDDHNQLLYVGITVNLLRRMRNHRTKVYWWDDVDYIVAESCDSLASAQHKEIIAITTERPEYNLIWNPGMS